ncbi:CaiB/BaiF CoA transferase family protein [Paraburkholderia caballeronis]|uniref:Formyl-CoA transferase n=1 Tax=Paraburkholderia caballeronis TaxID=416943 RepID=A0A1H7J938_9BURK|nr:CoA transferase [Paraburkholderia caballeronis]PXW27518.1 formyl-CoA transferase [Paraburkholderia caballeronis]PXX02992.1 formyl-CoA transferase [Paraburkholderia caballeronis]RAK03717.1 formyl-CoA transferase [Paraburkholderia caballeronis]SEC23899.1 formyl-CoA transferase [Paraburkholderia caballeronis]SEK71116.1 formyl-CoA transferase [Paraburkholderia caballeronis]
MSGNLLTGVRVLDLTNVLAGPFAGYQLALLGAEVIKIETPGTGDLARQLGADPALNRRGMGTSFLAQNAGKRSMTLNLKREAGKAIFRRLVAEADVVLENYRPGVMARLGLDYAALKEVRPTLVYCSISGYGQGGPLATAPAYDQIIQGRSGVMSITGDRYSAPLRVGYPVCDTIGGITAAFAIAAALVRRQRDGEGSFIDVSMLDSAIVTMGWIVSNQLIAGRSPVPMGNDNFTASPSGAFRTGRGLLNIAANKQEQFEALCRVLGADALAADPRFAEREARKLNRVALTTEIERHLSAHDALWWEARLNEAGVPAGPVLSVEEALAQPQVAHRNLTMTVPATASPSGDPITVTRSGFHVDGKPQSVELGPPELGAHTEAVLLEAGFSREEVARWREDGTL